MSRPGYVSVVLDDAINRSLDYQIPETLSLKVGQRLLVPVRGSLRKGTAIELKTRPEVEKVRPVHSLLDDEALVPGDLFELADWISRYYMTPLRKVLTTLLPSSVRGKAKTKTQTHIKRITAPGKLLELCKELQRKRPAQAKVLEVMIKQPKGLLLTELKEIAGVTQSPIDALIKEGHLSSEEAVIDRSPIENFEFFQTSAKTLTDEQARCLEGIQESLNKNIFETHLIHGITGSGKTEIYLQAIDTALSQKKSVIMLVPEIALTTQTIERLKGRFKEKIAILHHRLSSGERHDAWHGIAKGEIPIVVGARSALFSPAKNLGLIIVDEEQEGSYKQTDEMPCYHARDVAIMRAKLSGSTCVLGSATPSFESYTNALSGKYRLHTLKKRATKALLPTVRSIPIKENLLSDDLLEAIKVRYKRGEQVLLFLNRRGYHTTQVCAACREPLRCPHCDLTLTYHKKENRVACHLCDYEIKPPPRKCPSCKCPETLSFKGAGTEQIERRLCAIFPEIRCLRMDADTTRHKGSHDRLFKQFRSGKADVLIGTQMIAKGLHFPSVTLVGVINTDSALSTPDFRASEQVFQLLAQVSGRSGRGQLPGEVLIQTRLPDNAVISYASKEDYLGFYKDEIEVRRAFGYPPFSRLARLVFSGPSEEATAGCAMQVKHELLKRLPSSCTLFPVTPCGYAKIKDRFRFHLMIKAPKNIALPFHDLPSKIGPVRLLIDIDPLYTFL